MSDPDGTSLYPIAIGLAGPKEVTDKIVRVMKQFPSLRPVVRHSASELETPVLAAELASEVEALLLCGPVPYRKVLEKAPSGMPVHYVPYTETGLYRALYRMRSKLAGAEGLTLTVDTLTRRMAERTLKEIGETELELICFNPASAESDREELLRFHIRSYEEGRSAGALTGIRSVSVRLAEAGVPNEWIVPTDQDITVALERTLLSTESRRSREAQIVAGLINVDHFGRLAARRGSEHDIQKLKLDIHRVLLDYAESLSGHLTPLGGDEYLFFTTLGLFERETGGYKRIPLAGEVFRTYRLSLSMGIGFGRTGSEAGGNARLALRKAKEGGGGCCFIVREDGSLIGPLEMAEPLDQAPALADPVLLSKAEDAGLTSAYLSRLLIAFSRSGKQDYNVQELAGILQISVRSTHRLLVEWMDAGLVQISGVEKVPKGRPRQRFRFSFKDD